VPQPEVPQVPEGARFAGSRTGPEVEDQFPEEEGELTEFMAVLMEVATPAFIHLGLAEHPATGRPEINLTCRATGNRDVAYSARKDRW
jgi:hypothetical protein